MAFKAKHGHYDVPEESYPSLHYWVREKREEFRDAAARGESNPEEKDQFRRLSEIGFRWKVEPPPKNFATMLQHLGVYKAEHGKCNVPHDYEKNPALAAWCITQRKQLQILVQGNVPLDEEKLNQYRRLIEIGFWWHEVKRQCAHFEMRFQELLAFKLQHGHCHISKDRDSPLGRWGYYTRRKKRDITAGLKETKPEMEIQFARLEEVGFKWDNTAVKERFDERFYELVVFKAKYGHCLVPKQYKKHPYLRRWCYNQIQKRKKVCKGHFTNSEDEEQYHRLVQLGLLKDL
mmetsp:Transcript_17525/g.25574  ORF Transcript_17525/g.25574 Transcript_17525/m.25574 type:complete len:290 (+) Transcript_17525:1-870(+)